MTASESAQQLIDRLLPDIKGRMIAMARASWDRNTTGSLDAAQRAATLSQELKQLLADPGSFSAIVGLRQAGGAGDPIVDRQLDLLYRMYLSNQITPDEIRELVERETELGQLFNNFRATYQGREVSDNDLNNILGEERDNVKRKEAWLASKQIGVLAAQKIRALARLRNQIAQKVGFRDFFAMSLEAQEIDEQVLLDTLQHLAESSDKAYRSEKAALDSELAKRFGIDASAVAMWHYADPFFQKAPKGAGGPDLDQYFADKDIAALSVAFYDKIGLEVRDILGRSDLYERPGKMQHAFCTNIDREGDVRILCNLKPTERWMETQLHELGHAVYDTNIDRSIPWLLRRPAHTMTTEAIAQLMGRLTTNAHWLTHFAGVPSTEASAAAAFLFRQMKRTQLIFSRWGMVMTFFERALYADPDQDLGKVWWDLVARFQLLQRPADGDRSTDWAAKIHVANYPVYYHNYVLGEMTASQLTANLEREFGERWMLTEQAGRWLKERIFKPGNLLPWNERLAAATGERLNPAYFVKQFGTV